MTLTRLLDALGRVGGDGEVAARVLRVGRRCVGRVHVELVWWESESGDEATDDGPREPQHRLTLQVSPEIRFARLERQQVSSSEEKVYK